MSKDIYAFKEITENPIKLNFADCKYLGEIHKILKEKFGFHDFYGENRSALWDLTQDVFFGDQKYSVELYEFNSLSKELKSECERMLIIFDRLSQKNNNFTYKIIS